MTATNRNNGARFRILSALASEGMLTTDELAQHARLTPNQVRDNANAAIPEKLLTKTKDEVTHSLAYKITPVGRQWLSARQPQASALSAALATDEVSATSPAVATPPSAETNAVGLPGAEASIPAGVTAANPSTDDPHHDERDDTIAPATSSDSIDATEAPQPPEQYAICRSGQAHLAAWPLRDMTLDDAKQLAVDDAVATNGEVILYRCTPIGRAVPRIVFEEA